jgi:hypothetical protein
LHEYPTVKFSFVTKKETGDCETAYCKCIVTSSTVLV